MQFRTHIAKLDYLFGVNYFFIPSRIVEELGGKLAIRLICTVNNKLSFQCGLVALGNGDAYITINNARMKKLKLSTGDEVDLKLEKDESEYGTPMPVELDALLKQDEEGFRRFKLLAPGFQRYILQYVDGVKNPTLRIDRAVMMINNLKLSTEGKEQFRTLLGK